MRNKKFGFLLVIALVVFAFVASLQTSPGYMDADYYFYGGSQLANGNGFAEMVLWNFLDGPNGMPHPSHLYWMPLTSIVTFLGIKLFPNLEVFEAAQVIMILVAVGVVWVTTKLTYTLTENESHALLAGGLAVFSGLYLPYVTTTDAFGIYMLLGGIFFLTMVRRLKMYGFVLGAIAGLMHLTRADGVLWVFVGIVGLYINKDFKKHGLSLIGGYFVFMSAWYWRNWQLFGTLMPPGGSATIWMLDYNELFSFPASLLTFERWWLSGIGEILKVRWEALTINLISAVAVQGIIFGAPLILVGWWGRRKEAVMRVGLLAWGMVFMLMTFIFPFSGIRGGFFHSGAAMMPLIWGLVPVGLEKVVSWAGGKRGWNIIQAEKVFGVGILVLAVMVSGLRIFPRVVETWNVPAEIYTYIEENLVSFEAEEGDIVMVNNPPGYAWANQRPAVVIPNGDVDTLLRAADDYNVEYVILDENHPKSLSQLFDNPDNQPGLDYLGTIENVHYFKVEH